MCYNISMKKEYKDYRFTCNYMHLNKEDKLIVKKFIKELKIILDKKDVKFRQSWRDGKFFTFKDMSEASEAFVPMIRIKKKNGWDFPAMVCGKEVILFRE